MAQASLQGETETAAQPSNPPVYRVTRALTIHQPEAWLVCKGFQRVQNRTWDSGYCGLVAIHAGVHREHAPQEALEELMALGHEQISQALWAAQYKADELFYYGGIIGVAELLGCLPVDRIKALDEFEPPEPGQLPLATFAEGPFCWRLGKAGLLPTPVKCRGNFRLWTLDDETAAKVNGQLRFGPARQ